MTEKKIPATREHLEELADKVEKEIRELREERERNRDLHEKNATISWNREFHDLLESPEGIARIKRLAEEKGIDFGDAMIMVAEKELPEPPAGYWDNAAPEDKDIDRRARKLSEERGVSYEAALDIALDEMPDPPVQLSDEARSRDAEEGLLHDRAMKLSEREGIPYPEAFERVLDEAEGR